MPGPTWSFSVLKRPRVNFHSPLGMEKFTSPKFELDWLPPTVGLGSERPADQPTLFACLISYSETWFSVPEPTRLLVMNSFTLFLELSISALLVVARFTFHFCFLILNIRFNLEQ